MRWFLALIHLILLICPCALCYGQTSFSSVSGEGGYAAMKGSVKLDLDNGFILMPYGGYYRPSDMEGADQYATGKAGLQVSYDVNDVSQILVRADYIPKRAGFERTNYAVGARAELCYHCGIFTHSYIQVSAGQSFYKITPYESIYKDKLQTRSSIIQIETGTNIGKFTLQASYEKVLKYTHRPTLQTESYWAEIPFMTAIIQGFVEGVGAAKLSYHTRWITPYGICARYKYTTDGAYVTAWGAGLSLHWGKTTLSGGVENFESDSESDRQNYFSFSASMEF